MTPPEYFSIFVEERRSDRDAAFIQAGSGLIDGDSEHGLVVDFFGHGSLRRKRLYSKLIDTARYKARELHRLCNDTGSILSSFATQRELNFHRNQPAYDEAGERQDLILPSSIELSSLCESRLLRVIES